MKDADLQELVARIRQELNEIRHVLLRISEGWERFRRTNDDYYLDGVALNLHSFYILFVMYIRTNSIPSKWENWFPPPKPYSID